MAEGVKRWHPRLEKHETWGTRHGCPYPVQQIRACKHSTDRSARATRAEKEKARLISQTGLLFMPATTYSPTHFRGQYNRLGGALLEALRGPIRRGSNESAVSPLS